MTTQEQAVQEHGLSEHVRDIVFGLEIPATVAEIDELGALAAQYHARRPSMRGRWGDDPAIFTRFDERGIEPVDTISAEDYNLLCRVGNRDHWRLDFWDVDVFEMIAKGAPVPEIVSRYPDYAAFFDARPEEELDNVRREAQDRLDLHLAIEMHEVEEELTVLAAAELAMRTETSVLPVVTPDLAPEYDEVLAKIVQMCAGAEPATSPNSWRGRHRSPGFAQRLGRLVTGFASRLAPAAFAN